MTDLKENEKSFVRLMAKTEEHSRRGFMLLAERTDADRFFDALRDERLFDPNRNPSPKPGEKPNSLRVSYWPALAYLLACAKGAAQRSDLALAKKVMDVVREVGRFRETNGLPRDNPSTFAALAEIIGTVPTAEVTLDDIDMIPAWLDSKFGSLQVVASLDQAMCHFTASAERVDWQKALGIMRHCLAVRWQRGQIVSEEEPVAVTDTFWLEQIVAHHATGLGEKLGGEAATVFRDAAQEVFSKGSRATWSWLFRPAVENHGQNHSWRRLENAIIEGLRDATLAWLDSGVDKKGARAFVRDQLRSDVQMLRRAGIYLLDCRWKLLGALYSEACAPKLFDRGHIHELFLLLKNHFDDMDGQEKEATLTAIQKIDPPKGPKGDEILRHEQRQWLEALPGSYPSVAEWLSQLPVGVVGQHPDFNSYMESAVGPGPSPYAPDDLVAFAMDETLVGKLNTFVPPGTWRGPSVGGLTTALGQAVASAPEVFVDHLSDLVQAKPEFQQAVVSAFKGLWSRKSSALVDWQSRWPALMSYFEKVLATAAVLANEAGQDRSQEARWLYAAIADLLREGTRDDGSAYPVALLARGWALLEALIDITKSTQQPREKLDAMTQAINSPKGRVIEAVFSHALRACRVADASEGNHTAAWEGLRLLFERELQRCETDNYEFSTLAGSYIGHLDYMAPEWLRENLKRIFPAEHPDNLACALSGLAFAYPTRNIYALLRDGGVIEAGLQAELAEPEVRKVLVHHLMREYLLGGELLESSRIQLLFDAARLGELETAVRFLQSVQQQSPTEEQKAQIVAFWDRCARWAVQVLPEAPGELFAALGALAWALPNAEGRNRELLLSVTPWIGRDFRVHEFLRELLRLCDRNPSDTAKIFLKLLDSYNPIYDYDGLIGSLIQKLATLGQRSKALEACARLRSLPGVPELAAAIEEQQ